jgi:hypothetical protein
MGDILLRQVALVSESHKIDPGDLARVAAALQKQASRDLVQFWEVQSVVAAFPKLEDVPIGFWPIILEDDIQTPGAAGVHEDRNGQPFALVTTSDQLEVWSLTTSHEMIEMLVDPFGNRLVACDSPKADQGRVEILVEACDPSEAVEFAYTVNGILVSDFYSPRYFDPVAAPGVRYSFTGAIEEPRQVLKGGYLSWHDVASDMWWQETWFGGDSPTFRNLGRLSAANGSFRSQVDRLTSEATSRAVAPGLRAATVAGLSVASIDLASKNRAARWREQIDSLVRGETRPREEERLSETGQLAPFPAAQHIDAAKKKKRAEALGLRVAPSLRAG